jgi:hypothetical protein
MAQEDFNFNRGRKMKRINPPIQIKVSIPNLPFEAWQYFEIG